MLRPYQSELARKAARRVAKHGLCYLAIEMRVGKTLISMQTAKNLEARSVVFITKLKAIDSILHDYETFGYVHDFNIAVFNYEQIHKHTDVIRAATHSCIISSGYPAVHRGRITRASMRGRRRTWTSKSAVSGSRPSKTIPQPTVIGS